MIADASRIDRARLSRLSERERCAFSQRNPRSRALFDQARHSLLNGVPMSWMSHWAGGIPIFVAEANGASLTDVDGHTYADFCLGDTGALAGHAPSATAGAVRAQYERGATTTEPLVHYERKVYRFLQAPRPCCQPQTRPGSVPSSRGASAFPCGSSPSPPPTPTGGSFA